MNLYYNPSATALRQLVSQADKSLFAHNIAVDFDGEVIIDPELRYPGVDLKKYKFCTQIKSVSLNNMRKLQTLHAALLSTFKEQLHSIGRYDLKIAA